MRYQISKKAVEDLEKIWIYTYHNWSEEQADRYYSLIISEIEYVSKEPQAGRSYNRKVKGYNMTKVKSHLIFYLEKSEGILVVRILHEMMDIDR